MFGSLKHCTYLILPIRLPRYCLGTTDIQKCMGTETDLFFYLKQCERRWMMDGTNHMLNITLSRVNYKTEVAIFLKSIYITVKQKIWRHSGINIASARRYQVTGAGGAESRLLNCEPWKEITLNYCLETAIVVSSLASNLRHL